MAMVAANSNCFAWLVLKGDDHFDILLPFCDRLFASKYKNRNIIAIQYIYISNELFILAIERILNFGANCRWVSLMDPSFLRGHMICFLPSNEKFVAKIKEREGISWYARHSL